MIRGSLRTVTLSALGTALLLGGGGEPVAAQETRILLMVGLGGTPEYRATFHGWATQMRDASVRMGVPPENIIYLGERPDDTPGEVNGKSDKEGIEAALEQLSREAGREDRILLVFIGHGSSQGQEAVFNLPGRDISGDELSTLLDLAFPTQTVGIVNTAPASGPFVAELSGPRRIVLTATRSAGERNETRFGEYFAQSFEGDQADLDKDGRLSLLEAFEFTRSGVARYYEEQGLLMTEHAQLDDNGDGSGSDEPGPDAADGGLARMFYVGAPRAVTADGTVGEPTPDDITDPELRRLYDERAALERQIDQLRANRASMSEEEYDSRLEDLLVEMALKTQEIRAKGGGGR